MPGSCTKGWMCWTKRCSTSSAPANELDTVCMLHHLPNAATKRGQSCGLRSSLTREARLMADRHKLLGLMVMLLLALAVAPTDAAETSYQTGFTRWRAAEAGFAGWTRQGVQLNANGTLAVDPNTAAPGSDPYAAGTYYGGNYYTGGSFLVGHTSSAASLPSTTLNRESGLSAGKTVRCIAASVGMCSGRELVIVIIHATFVRKLRGCIVAGICASLAFAPYENPSVR